ncbi:hypothetical protein AAMO2058_000647200, partial [Amorphochlora amoebiformis]
AYGPQTCSSTADHSHMSRTCPTHVPRMSRACPAMAPANAWKYRYHLTPTRVVSYSTCPSNVPHLVLSGSHGV